MFPPHVSESTRAQAQLLLAHAAAEIKVQAQLEAEAQAQAQAHAQARLHAFAKFQEASAQIVEMMQTYGSGQLQPQQLWQYQDQHQQSQHRQRQQQGYVANSCASSSSSISPSAASSPPGLAIAKAGGLVGSAGPKDSVAVKDSVRNHLQELRVEDPLTIFVMRGVACLGFQSQALIEKYVTEMYGPVRRVLVAHSKVKKSIGGDIVNSRMRPGNVGFVVMANAEDVQRVLDRHSQHGIVITGSVVQCQPFVPARAAGTSGSPNDSSGHSELPSGHSEMSRQVSESCLDGKVIETIEDASNESVLGAAPPGLSCLIAGGTVTASPRRIEEVSDDVTSSTTSTEDDNLLSVGDWRRNRQASSDAEAAAFADGTVDDLMRLLKSAREGGAAHAVPQGLYADAPSQGNLLLLLEQMRKATAPIGPEAAQAAHASAEVGRCTVVAPGLPTPAVWAQAPETSLEHVRAAEALEGLAIALRRYSNSSPNELARNEGTAGLRAPALANEHPLPEDVRAGSNDSCKQARQSAPERLDTLRAYLSETTKENPACILVVRRISKLGFHSRDLLQQYFQQFGSVTRVLVAHSKVRVPPSNGDVFRTRPGSLGIVIMKYDVDAKAALDFGEEQVVAGVQIRVAWFERPEVHNAMDDAASTSASTAERQSSPAFAERQSSPADTFASGSSSVSW